MGFQVSSGDKNIDQDAARDRKSAQIGKKKTGNEVKIKDSKDQRNWKKTEVWWWWRKCDSDVLIYRTRGLICSTFFVWEGVCMGSW